MFIRSRREFLSYSLRSISALGATSVLAKFGEMNAMAASQSGYQALVCIFLAGGNDGHNTVIPLSTIQQNYNLYLKGRQGLAPHRDRYYRSPTAMTRTAFTPTCLRFRTCITMAKRQYWPTSETLSNPSTALDISATTAQSCQAPCSRIPIKPASGRARSPMALLQVDGEAVSPI